MKKFIKLKLMEEERADLFIDMEKLTFFHDTVNFDPDNDGGVNLFVNGYFTGRASKESKEILLAEAEARGMDIIKAMVPFDPDQSKKSDLQRICEYGDNFANFNNYAKPYDFFIVGQNLPLICTDNSTHEFDGISYVKYAINYAPSDTGHIYLTKENEEKLLHFLGNSESSLVSMPEQNP